MELGRRQRAALHRSDETSSMLGPRDGGTVCVARGVRVHEVEPLPFDAAEQRRARRRLHGVPAHVRHDLCLESRHLAGKYADAIRADTVLDAALVEHLHPDADTEHGTFRAQTCAYDVVDTELPNPVHACCERTDSGDDESVRVVGIRDLAGYRHIRADACERALGRAQVARPVVDNDDARLHSRNAPAAVATTPSTPSPRDSNRGRCNDRSTIAPSMSTPPSVIRRNAVTSCLW